MTAVVKDDAVSCVAERDTGGDEIMNIDNNNTIIAMSRKEKRKALKKMKRKQLRRDIALKEREEEETRLNNPEEQMRLLRLQQEETERMERDRMEFEERERRFLEELEKKKREEEEEEKERRKSCEESKAKSGDNNELDEDDEWEYIEDGPAEIIWKGNEIIVKKKKVRVRKKSLGPENVKQECDRPTSNPLAPQSEAFEDYKSAQEVLECVAQQVPNFGTEQDKAHCPFHLKTGVCRFGARCSRVHFYPDKSCTLLLKNMYSGPGLAWEHDEGLEYTDEEVELSFEDFYEDVHTEFLKFGEIVNFKVCKNSSPHLRGNVYVHYKLLESAVVAYQSVSGRYFAGKQVSCEFVNIARWKVAICGEYMKSRLKTCSRGSACNFIHCFRNPGGDYEWADWDKPAPRYWVKKMAALFGFSDDRLVDEVSPRYGSKRSRSRGPESSYSKGRVDEDDGWKRENYRRHKGDSRERISEAMHEGKMSSQLSHHDERRKGEAVDLSDYSSDEQKTFARHKRSSRRRGRDSELTREDNKIRKHEVNSGKTESVNKGENNRYHECSSRRSTRHKRAEEATHDHYCRDKVHNFEPMKNLDKHYDKYCRHKRKHSIPREDADSSDIDSHGYSLKKDKHRRRSHNKRSSKQVKNDADFSDCVSDGEISRDGTRRQKSGRRSSRSKNESGFMIIESSRERPYSDDRLNRSGRKSSRHHSEDAGLSNIDSKCYGDVDSPEEKEISSERHNDGDYDKYSSSRVASYEGCEYEKYDKRRDVEHRLQINDCNGEATASQKAEVNGRHSSCLDLGESESEREQAYRLAALKKLDERRKSKDSQSAHSHGYESARTYSHDNLEFKGKEVSKDPKEVLDLSKAETSDSSTKRRRI